MQWIQDMLQFFISHSQLIAVVAGILLAAVHAAQITGSLRQGLLALMLQAEKASASGELGDVTGYRITELVVQLAMQRVVPQLPLYARPFFTEQRVRRFAYFVYAEAKLYLQSGHLLPPADPPSSAVPSTSTNAPVQDPPAVSPPTNPAA
ncbi:MAG TPA: hypothetical protein VGK74_22120 [Symbiobacteriaceae bacterium]|jgi:hypothetical protein